MYFFLSRKLKFFSPICNEICLLHFICFYVFKGGSLKKEIVSFLAEIKLFMCYKIRNWVDGDMKGIKKI